MWRPRPPHFTMLVNLLVNRQKWFRLVNQQDRESLRWRTLYMGSLYSRIQSFFCTEFYRYQDENYRFVVFVKFTGSCPYKYVTCVVKIFLTSLRVCCNSFSSVWVLWMTYQGKHTSGSCPYVWIPLPSVLPPMALSSISDPTCVPPTPNRCNTRTYHQRGTCNSFR